MVSWYLPQTTTRYKRSCEFSIVTTTDTPNKAFRSRCQTHYYHLSACFQAFVVIAAFLFPSTTSLEFSRFLAFLGSMSFSYSIKAKNVYVWHSRKTKLWVEMGSVFLMTYKTATHCLLPPLSYLLYESWRLQHSSRHTCSKLYSLQALRWATIQLFWPPCAIFLCHALHSGLCTIHSLILASETVCRTTCCERASWSILLVSTAQAEATDASFLHHDTLELALAKINTCASLVRPVPSRVRSGWTRAFENAAERRTALLCKGDDNHNLCEGKTLDRLIKREFRKRIVNWLKAFEKTWKALLRAVKFL